MPEARPATLTLAPQGVPAATDDAVRLWSRSVALTVNQVLQGRSNNTGSVTLGSGTTTTVQDRRAGADSVVLWTPLNAAAAAVLASGTCYLGARGEGAFTINHAEPVGTAVLAYAIVG